MGLILSHCFVNCPSSGPCSPCILKAAGILACEKWLLFHQRASRAVPGANPEPKESCHPHGQFPGASHRVFSVNTTSIRRIPLSFFQRPIQSLRILGPWEPDRTGWHHRRTAAPLGGIRLDPSAVFRNEAKWPVFLRALFFRHI